MRNHRPSLRNAPQTSEVYANSAQPRIRKGRKYSILIAYMIHIGKLVQTSFISQDTISASVMVRFEIMTARKQWLERIGRLRLKL